MTNQEKFNKAQGRVQCILNEKCCELSDLMLKKFSLVNSLDSIEYQAMNKKANNEINEYKALMAQKEEGEKCLATLIDEIGVLGVFINALRIGIVKIKEGVVPFEVDPDIDLEIDDNDEISRGERATYNNKVSKPRKRFGR